MGEDVGNENRAADVGLRTSDIRCELRDGDEALRICLTAKIERPRFVARGPEPDSSQFREPMFVRVPDHLGDAGEGGDLFRSALRVAASDHDLCIRIFAMNTADGGAGVLVSGGRYGASVENDQAGSRG